MRLLCILLASTTIGSSFLAWHYLDMMKKWQHLAEVRQAKLDNLLPSLGEEN